MFFFIIYRWLDLGAAKVNYPSSHLFWDSRPVHRHLSRGFLGQVWKLVEILQVSNPFIEKCPSKRWYVICIIWHVYTCEYRSSTLLKPSTFSRFFRGTSLRWAGFYPRWRDADNTTSKKRSILACVLRFFDGNKYVNENMSHHSTPLFFSWKSFERNFTFSKNSRPKWSKMEVTFQRKHPLSHPFVFFTSNTSAKKIKRSNSPTNPSQTNPSNTT